jgi:hypothetical protein
MTRTMHPPPTVDLLASALDRVRPLLMNARTTKDRVRLLWAAIKKSRDLGAPDVVSEEFMRLAIETNLIDRRGRWTGSDVRESERRFGAEDVAHVISWAMRGWNPFGEGKLK